MRRRRKDRLTRRRDLVSCLLLLACGPAPAGETRTSLAPGITWIRRTTSRPLRIHILRIELGSPRIRFETAIAHDAVYGPQERTSAMAARRGADTAVNADYFGAGHHNCEELFVSGGRKIYEPPAPFRSILNLTRGNEPSIGMAREGLSLYSTVGGGPHFVVRGRFRWDQSVPDRINGEGFRPNTVFDSPTNPWTAVACTRDRKTLILAVVDGRQPGWSVGVSPAEMAEILIGEGAWEGMRFDGGGSTTLYVAGRGVVNRPSDGSERPVGTALLVFADRRPYFRRGDANGDGARDIADAIAILVGLFEAGARPLACLDAADLDDSGRLDLADPIGLLNWLFAGGPRPRPPYPDCGPDRRDDGLGCADPPADCP